MLNKDYRRLIWVVILLAVISGGCSRSSGLQIVSHDLTVRQFTGDLNSIKSMAVVTGSAKNSSSAPLSDCNINVRYFDADKNLIGVSSAYKQFMEPGEVWSFTVQLTAPDAWKARSYEISGTSR
ncbi:MAG: FxLYD domain-containing protein [Dehalococcoidia bacterium]|nr:FxLYD domain-containing protein [Dehalococcoidia bacterium]